MEKDTKSYYQVFSLNLFEEERRFVAAFSDLSDAIVFVSNKHSSTSLEDFYRNYIIVLSPF